MYIRVYIYISTLCRSQSAFNPAKRLCHGAMAPGRYRCDTPTENDGRNLVGGWATPLKNMTSSIGMMKAIPN